MEINVKFREDKNMKFKGKGIKSLEKIDGMLK
jgi:hypothetical protein